YNNLFLLYGERAIFRCKCALSGLAILVNRNDQVLNNGSLGIKNYNFFPQPILALEELITEWNSYFSLNAVQNH
ncbi:MAG: hypothetical protein ACTSRK_21050, partial [Promethearchaeota archaeon]